MKVVEDVPLTAQRERRVDILSAGISFPFELALQLKRYVSNL